MVDQAQALRNLVKASAVDGQAKQTRVITVTSGKGGVGKSNFTLNFALALQSQGYKVVIFDADIGLANLDVLMGMSPQYHLYHLLKKEKTIHEIIHQGPGGLQLVAGGSGFNDLLSLTDEQLEYFVEQVSQLSGVVDFILFDTGAGLSKETLKFIVSAEQTFVVTTPEPTSITDAYAIIKMVQQMDHHNVQFKLVINRVSDWEEGKATSDKISFVAKRFLGIDIETVGYVSDDSHVSKSVKKQVPFLIEHPSCSASRDIQRIAKQFISGSTMNGEQTGLKGFLTKMIRFMK
ncbi:MinD/ParA family protein [Marinicrinis lubricantis]|uniref:MinD/ParA family protein n=1 Tax=Marinicrinis lubricantis TaxID=2086470 RepID=A0ABW1IMF9_9BACL